jgi:N-acetylglucosaminyl-diphospho-decaprenol L-rhamnosyltransferase
MARVAIVIVTYNSESGIAACLDALADLTSVEVLVVDNASADATCDKVLSKDIRLIANTTNVGFAAAVNQGVRATRAPLILLLNPDTQFIQGLDALTACLEIPGSGAAGGLLVGANETPQAGFMVRRLPTAATLVFEVLGINRIWPGNPVNWHYRCKDLDPMDAALVEQPAGAFLMFPRAVWELVGGFDERFWPVWFEDVDFCVKLRSAGLRVYYDPKARARHQGSHSICSLSVENRERYWYRSLLEYAAKHFRPIGFRTICLAVAAGAVFRAVRLASREGWKAFVVYGNVVGLALRHFFRFRAGSSGNCCLKE